MDKGYKVARNPTDRKWYVVGHCGGKWWMPISNSFDTKSEAEKHLHHQHAADKDARINGCNGI